MLRNPKYTGYNVWGRHDKRPGRPFIRPRTEWVWSPVPVHEPIVPRELFEIVEERARANEHHAKQPVAKTYSQRNGRRGGRLYPLRGRVRCALCGRRMEGSHQKGSNWYRCLFVYRRSITAADVAGHPRVIGIRENAIVEELFDFLSERIFGPDRLRLLRDELAGSVASAWDEHQLELDQLKRELEEVERGLYRQALRLEEHDDPDHPVVALAKRRIEELSARRTTITDSLKTLEASRPTGARPEEIEAMLDAVPDLRSALPDYNPEDLAELFDALQVEVTFDKPKQALEIAATLTPELVLLNETERPPQGRSLNSVIAGAGFEPATSGI
jgi:site-specific DNA recombinase